jgi:hypothetical protein
MATHTKMELLAMNSDRVLGFNWIKNIANIKDNEQARLYPTGDAGFMSGRIYIALPATMTLTNDIIQKYNIWL